MKIQTTCLLVCTSCINMKSIFNLEFINSLGISIWCKSELSKGLIQNILLNTSFSLTLTPTYNSYKKKKVNERIYHLLPNLSVHSSDMPLGSYDAMWIYTGIFLNLCDTYGYIGLILNTSRKWCLWKIAILFEKRGNTDSSL